MVEEQEDDDQHHRPPPGAASIARRVLHRLKHPGQRCGAAGVAVHLNRRAQQPADRAAAHRLFRGQEQDQDQQDRQGDLHQVQHVCTGQAHVVRHLANRLDPLFARLEHRSQEQAAEISERRQDRRDDHIAIGNVGQRGEHEGRDPHDRRHDRPAGGGRRLHPAGENL